MLPSHQGRCRSERTEQSGALIAVGTVRLTGPSNAAWACTSAGRSARADVNPSQARAPCRSRPCCPIRIVSVHLLDATGQLLRVLFLDREGHISAQPHYVPRAEALILASNQQIVLGPQAQLRVL